MCKNTIRMGRWLAIAVAIGLVCATQAQGGGKPPKYTLVDLDGRPESVMSVVSDVTLVNNTITCVGMREEADLEKAVLWEVTPAGSSYSVTLHYLLDGEYAVAINADGEVVGVHLVVDQGTQLLVYRGLYWPDFSASPLPVDPLSGDNETRCCGINNAGVIVGSSTKKYLVPDGQGQWVQVEEETAVFWRAVDDGAGGATIAGPFVLGVQPGVSTARRADSVNNCDADGVAQVVGIYNDFGPAMWQVDCDTLESIGPFALVPPGVTSGTASSVNDNGDSCGGWMKPFRRLADGTFQLLSLPSRSLAGDAKDINIQRQVVGDVHLFNRYGATVGVDGVLWEPDGTRKDLNSFLGGSGFRHIQWAKAITDGGIIAGNGQINPGEGRPLLMIPQ